MKKICLEKETGPVVFIGGMNALPMMYAIELKKLGYDVLYFVDAPISDTLSRPENHFSDITYPYPDWIVEFPLVTQMVLPFLRKYYSKKIEERISSLRKTPTQVYVLNGFFISLAPYLSGRAKKIALSHGSDFHSWADIEGVNNLANSFKARSVFKYMPAFLAKKLIGAAVRNQYDGFKYSDRVVCFPKGFNKFGDRVQDRLRKDGVEILERYDISFEPLKNEKRDFKSQGKNIVIFSGVRFMYKTFSEGDLGCSKGNDHIVHGLGAFFKERKDIEIHFVEKGPDVEAAKKLCSENGLEDVVVWHSEMKFKELLELYRLADICFDQVGDHWIGAIGGYALWLGKPLIANDALPVKVGFWPEENPVFRASSAEEVCAQLKALADEDVRECASEMSKSFAERYMAPNYLLNNVFDFR